MQSDIGTAYLSADDKRDYVRAELKKDFVQHGSLFIKPGPPVPCRWAINTWTAPRIISFDSIGDAVKKLTAIQRNWFGYSHTLHRRSSLIQAALPPISIKPRQFPYTIPDSPMGGYCLTDANTMIASPVCTSPFPGGRIAFEENKTDPPSTAYLKLWEALTRLGRLPGPGDRCLDFGACPGGWTWVLLESGANVLAVDRSPLDPRFMNHPRVEFRQGNAFALKQESSGAIDWFCSDIVAYPRKLYDWLVPWIESGRIRQFVVTIKMQGEPDWESIDLFAAVEGSTIYHGSYNKHELTWLFPAPEKTAYAM